MNEKKHMPSREMLDEAFHMLQDAITRITVDEEAFSMKQEHEGKQS
ncbi:MAG: hypothetical protein Q8898_08375 [Bacillota bacterium]|nr:hypothetical protein [Bacillota bacterium]